MFVYAPLIIAGAPYESTMGLVQKIFYFHVPAWIAMFIGGRSSAASRARSICSRRAARPIASPYLGSGADRALRTRSGW